jgi:hypothetical protein
VPGSLEAYEFSDILQILSEYELLAFGHDRHVAHAELQQPLATARVIEDVDMLVVNAFSRKKLFRTETTASPGLREQGESVCDGVHLESKGLWKGLQGYSPRAQSVKASEAAAMRGECSRCGVIIHRARNRSGSRL